MFLPGIGGHLKVSHMDPRVSFGNESTNLSVQKSFLPFYIKSSHPSPGLFWNCKHILISKHQPFQIQHCNRKKVKAVKVSSIRQFCWLFSGIFLIAWYGRVEIQVQICVFLITNFPLYSGHVAEQVLQLGHLFSRKPWRWLEWMEVAARQDKTERGYDA